jgi:hypothetical protein
MTETLLFTNHGEMLSVREKIYVTFPNAYIISESSTDPDNFDVTWNFGAIDMCSWCKWALESGVFLNCRSLVLQSLDPPDWMKCLIEAHRLKEEAKRLSGN